MATSLIPDSNTPPNDQNQNQNPAPTSTDFEKLIQVTLGESERARRDAEQRARDLEDENTRLRNQAVNTQTPSNVPEDPQSFWNKPVENITQLIQAQLKPVYESAAANVREKQYNSFKTQYRQYPGFDKIESTVDNFMEGQEITHANMQAAIQRAVGFLLLNNPQTLANAIPNNQQPVNNQPTGNLPPVPNAPRQPDLQAHLRPSNNAPPVDNKPTRRPLTENEKRVIKEMGTTEEKYWELLDQGAKVQDWKKEGK